MVKKQHIARHTEYTATHMGDKTLNSQRLRNHGDGQQSTRYSHARSEGNMDAVYRV